MPAIEGGKDAPRLRRTLVCEIMNKLRLIGMSGAVGFVLFLLYVGVLHLINDGRLDDDQFLYDEMNYLERFFFIFEMFALAFGWGYAVYKAYWANNKRWMIAIWLFWPVYAFYLFQKVERNTNQ
jgi:hypothetical protein